MGLQLCSSLLTAAVRAEGIADVESWETLQLAIVVLTPGGTVLIGSGTSGARLAMD